MGWTLDALVLHLTMLVGELDKRVDVALDAQRTAVDAALVAVNERLKLLNELRSLVTDVLAQTVPRSEWSTVIEGLRRDIDAVSRDQSNARSRSGGLHAGWVILVGAIATVGTLVSAYVVLRGH